MMDGWTDTRCCAVIVAAAAVVVVIVWMYVYQGLFLNRQCDSVVGIVSKRRAMR